MSKNIWFKKEINLSELNRQNQKTMLEHLDITLDEVGEDFLSGSMPIDHRTIQPFKILHGGASCVLAESLGSIAANMVIDHSKFRAVGQSLQASHLRPGLKGRIHGSASPLHLGRKSQVWKIDLFNEDKKAVCHVTLTMAIIEKV